MKLDVLLAALSAAPHLPGAACGGRSELFDPAIPGENELDLEYRQEAARRICTQCNALASCSAWFDRLPPARRPLGVVAARINQPKPPGRPPKTTAPPTGSVDRGVV